MRLRSAALALGLTAAVLSSPAAVPAAQPGALEAEVAAGRLASGVLEELRAHGNVEALLSVRSREIMRDAAAAAPTGPDRVAELIEEMQERFGAEEAEALARAAGDVEVEARLPRLPVSVVRFASEDALLQTLRDPDVQAVVAPSRFTAADAESLPLIGQPAVERAGHRGAGTHTAVLDSGVDWTRLGCTAVNAGPGCKVAETHEAAPDDGTLDSSTHGTHVAGIVAATAPGTRIIGVDVFDKPKGGDTRYALMGIDWVLKRRAAGVNIRAVNMSLSIGGTFFTSSCGGPENPYAASIAALRRSGIAPVVAAGNDGYDGAARNGVAIPACSPGAISVGATYDQDWPTSTWNDEAAGCSDTSPEVDQIACFSQRGPHLSLFAPGNNITAAGITASGTSMATPFVAGAVAVLAGAVPSASVDAVERALTTSGPVISGTTRRLDVNAALERLLPSDQQAPVMTQAPAHALDGALSQSDERVPVRVTWAGSDNVGVARYDAWLSTDGGAWAPLTPSNHAAPGITVALDPGHSYQVAVRAVDAKGLGSAYVTGAPFSLAVQQEDSLAYEGAWDAIPHASYFGGTARATRHTGATATLRFTGREVAWVSARSPLRGKADVFLDGAHVATVDQYGDTTGFRQVVFSRRFDASREHTLTVRTQGTPGRERVDVDAFVVMR